MKNKTDIEENIKILNNLKNKMDFNNQNDLVLLLNFQEQQALENILADRERLEKENANLKQKLNEEWEEWNNLEQSSYETEQKLKAKNKQLQAKANKYNSLIEEIEDKIKEIGEYSDIARELIEEKIIIADSDSLNFGRQQAHNKDREVLKELLDTEKEKI